MMAPSEVGVFPVHATSDDPQRHKSKSKRTRSSNSLLTSESSPNDQLHNASTGSPVMTSIHNFRPGQSPRTNLAPVIPLPKTHPPAAETNSCQNYSHRNSVASIKDDPFFRNYQTPQSVSLARELKSASYSSNVHGDETPVWINRKSTAATQANLNVRFLVLV
jgi:hypothetical protein